MIHELPWKAKKTRVAIIGDLILDEYLEGKVSRISPEAPVPIHLVRNKTWTAGGAGNVALNITGAGGDALLFGVLGNDAAGERFIELMREQLIDISGIYSSSDRPTTRKTRITSNHHQMLRVDWEETHPLERALSLKILKQLKTQSFDALLLSDYGKGCLSEELIQGAIEIALSRKVPTIIDPKGKDYNKYRGATFVTPNRKEALECLGMPEHIEIDHQQLAVEVQKKWGLQNVLLTLGSQGMTLSTQDQQSIYLPADTREVFDVSGAGDTVAALLSLGVASGADLRDAMHIANVGAGKVVEKWGTVPILKSELEDALFGKDNSATSGQNLEAKILSQDNFEGFFGTLHQRGMTLVFTNGCFDLLHAGHVSYLSQAKQLGDILIVGVNSDASISRIKGPSRPIVPLKQRMQVLAALSMIDYVIPFEEDTPREIIEKIQPGILVKGADWDIDKIVGADFVLSRGGRVQNIELEEGLSSTSMIQKIIDNYHKGDRT